MRGWEATETCRTVVPDREHSTPEIRFAVEGTKLPDKRVSDALKSHAGALTLGCRPLRRSKRESALLAPPEHEQFIPGQFWDGYAVVGHLLHVASNTPILVLGSKTSQYLRLSVFGGTPS